MGFNSGFKGLTSALDGVGGQRHPPPSGRFTPGKYPAPIVMKAGWTPVPFWTSAEMSPPPGFDLRTVHPVASRYTDLATQTRYIYIYIPLSPTIWYQLSTALSLYQSSRWPQDLKS